MTVVGETFVRVRPETRDFAQQTVDELNPAAQQASQKLTQTFGKAGADGGKALVENFRRQLGGGVIADTFQQVAQGLQQSGESPAAAFKTASEAAQEFRADALQGFDELGLRADTIGNRLKGALGGIAVLFKGNVAGAVRELGAFDSELGKLRQRQAGQDLLGGLTSGGTDRRLGALIGRFTLLGFAVNAAFQTLQRLQKGLQTTGDEAFTTEGKLKNALSAAIGGDVVGVWDALTAKEQIFNKGLTDAVAKLKQARDEASQISIEDVLSDSRAFEQSLDNAREGALAIGKSTNEAADFAQHYRDEVERAAAAWRNNEQIIGDVERAIQKAGAEAAAFGERGSGFGRGVGGVTASNQFQALTGGTGPSGQSQFFSDLPPGIRAAILREQGPGGTEQGLIQVLRQAIANRQKRLEELLRQKPQTAEMKNKVAAAIVAVRSDLNAFDSQLQDLLDPDKGPTRGRRAFQLPPRFLEAQQLAEATEGLADDLSVANRILAFLERQKDIAKRGTDRFREIVVAIGQARHARTQILEDIANDRKSDAADAADALRRALGVQEQKLQNLLAIAEMTEGEADDRKFLQKLRDFYHAQVRNLKLTEEERLRFRSQEIATVKRLKDLKAQEQSGFSLTDFLNEESSLFQKFGSNFGQGPLSAQDFIGLVAGKALQAATRAETPATGVDVSAIVRRLDRGGLGERSARQIAAAMRQATGGTNVPASQIPGGDNPPDVQAEVAQASQRLQEQQLAESRKQTVLLERIASGAPKAAGKVAPRRGGDDDAGAALSTRFLRNV